MTKELLENEPQVSDFEHPTIQFQEIPIEGYESVYRILDPSRGLHAIIAIHNTTLGPALGGIRIYPYATLDQALTDVLRLSKGMTYKSATAGVGLGGGKSVIIADPKTEKTPELLQAFGEAVDLLKGRYICAEDVGCTPQDVAEIRKSTQFVVGLPSEKSSGDPGFYTAWGVFRGIQACLQKVTGSDSLQGRTVAIQGLGNVGGNLANYLFWAGADLIVSDLDEKRAEEFATRYNAKVVPSSEILSVPCDVLAPCAMGGIINEETILHLSCRAISGAANNQLLKDSDADLLFTRGILYAPDFIVNAGGLLNVAQEIEVDGYSPTSSRNKTHRIYDTLLSVFSHAEKNKQSTSQAAIDLAESYVRDEVGKRVLAPIFHHSSK